MTRDDIINELAALEDLIDTQLVICHVIVGPDGKPTGEKIYRFVQQPRDSRNGDPRSGLPPGR